MWATMRLTRRAATVLLGAIPILAMACGTVGGTSPLAAASATSKPSLADVEVVADGVGRRTVGAVLKNVNPAYAFAIRYQATLYDAQGAQVGVFRMLPDVNLLPGEMVAIDGGGDATAPPVRFTLAPDPKAFVSPCAYPVLNASKVPAPVPFALGVWTKSHPVDPKFPSGTQSPGEVTGTLQVPSARQGLKPQALLYDGAGHLTGLGDGQQLTTADGPTPVRIVFRESFSYSSFPNPWGPVAQATITAYDDMQPLLTSRVLGACQRF
jgi:hypothetical protein